MSAIQAAVLGIVQGLAEFLPISSSGHLIMVPFLLGWEEHSQEFDLALHLGTTIALLWFFWTDWVALARSFVRGLGSAEVRATDRSWHMALLVLLGSIPAGVIGIVAEKPVAQLFRGSVVNAILLILFGLLLWLADSLGARKRGLDDVTWKDALLVGIAQAVALMPGVSRSGITITAALGRGMDRAAAARFSFLLSGPIILGAALFKLRAGVSPSELVPVVVGTAAAAITGWAAIGFLLRYLQTNSTFVFVVYRIAFGVLVLAVAWIR